MNREQLEDAVWELPHIQATQAIEFDDIQAMSNDQLRAILAASHSFVDDPALSDKPLTNKAPQRTKERWTRASVALRVIDDKLCSVETWASSHGHMKEHVYLCGVNVTFEGRQISSSIVKHYLLTGQWVKRVPKPMRYRAVARVGGKVTHLGYFDTLAERDVAIAAAKSMA